MLLVLTLGSSRLAYSWVTFDQEMSLFHDRQPNFEVDDCNAPIPCNNELWSATSVDSWKATLQGIHRQSSQAAIPSCSLAQLFNMFMNNELSGHTTTLSSTELRLLLQPLQALIYHMNKSLHYSFNPGSQWLLQRHLTQFEEVQFLLTQWNTICNHSISLDDPSAYDSTNMVMFHLISLNASTYLPDIEKLARGDMSPEIFQKSTSTGSRCSQEGPRIWCHCGQVIRYYRKMPASSRPYWWSAAIYRIALCMWAATLCSNTNQDNRVSTQFDAEIIAVDALPFDHPSIVRYLRHQAATPALSRADGSVVALSSPVDAVEQCIEVLKEEILLSQLDAVVCSRLSTFVSRWRMV